MSYLDYVNDKQFERSYMDYQKRWRDTVRESDRVLIEMVRQIDKERGCPLSILDVGCSTGNLLYHLKREVPGHIYTGIDMMRETIGANRSDPALTGINFEVADATDFAVPYRWDQAHDVVIANALLFVLDERRFGDALENIWYSMKRDGVLLAFDFVIPGDQSLEIVEVSESHPQGMTIHMRSRQEWIDAWDDKMEFRPFEIPIDLPGDGGLTTRTVDTDDGRRMLFRGALYQPWTHIKAMR